MFVRPPLASLTLVSVLLALAACRPPGDGAVACGELEPRSDDEVALCNDLGQAVIAEISMPPGPAPAGGWPGVVLLHGSGGLFYTEDIKEPRCSVEVQDQFQHWADLLNDRGYAVIMPASFYSRGFCEWNERRTVPRKLTDEERLVVRTFDAAAAANYLCDDPDVDCDHLALLGWSNGASVAMMTLHEDLGDADDPRLRGLDSIPTLVGGVAYYPGCGLQGELSTSLDAEDVDRYFFPHAPMWVPHGGKDSLADDCEEIRDPQVDVVAADRGVSEDMFEIEVYAGAEHGFDIPDSGESSANRAARTDAEQKTLARLDAWLTN